MSIRPSRLFVACFALALGFGLAQTFAPAQGITIPNTFTNDTIADAPQVNANFAALAANALNRNGGTLGGTLNLNGQTLSGAATFSGAVTFSSVPAGVIPAGLALYGTTGTCPTGWSEVTAARGLYVVGLPAGGTNAGTSGTALTNLEARAVGQHNHAITDPTHNHTQNAHQHSIFTANAGGGSNQLATAGGNGTFGNNLVGEPGSVQLFTATNIANSTGITINNQGSVAGTNAPYIQYPLCKKD